jgi:hypothetical protein
MMRLEASLNIPKQVILAMCVICLVWEQDGRSRFVDIRGEKELDVFNSVSKSSLHWDTGDLLATFSDTLSLF